MLQTENLGYDSWQTVHFQRATVILTELVLVYALYRFIQSSPLGAKKQAHAAALSILLSPGLLIIDHIHFQYNGFLYGILILSIVWARKQSGLLTSGIVFAALLCLKHIYLYLAPAYFVYLLRAYCLGPRSVFDIKFVNCFKLGASLAAVFGVAFGPFVYYKQIPQVLSRLFPFSRGLCHAYWAPNVWAMYSFTDRVLIYGTYRSLGLQLAEGNLRHRSRTVLEASSQLRCRQQRNKRFGRRYLLRRAAGYQSANDLLPHARRADCKFKPKPLTVTPTPANVPKPALIKLFLRPTWDNFVATITLCGYASFLFGWHVHEKAILLVIIPFSLLALKDRRYLGAFRPLAVSGHVSLFPLLFTSMEFPIKVVYTVTWLIVMLLAFDRLAPA